MLVELRSQGAGIDSSHFVGGHPLPDFDMQPAFTQHEVLLGHHMMRPVDEDGQNIDIQGLCQLECAFMETDDLTRLRTGAFGEDHHRIAAFNEFLQTLHILVVAVGNRIKLGETDDDTIDRVFPDPVRGEQHHLGMEHHRAKQVQMRLVVGDDDSWFLKGFTHLVVEAKLHPRQSLQGQAHEASNHLVVTVTLLLRREY